MIPSKIYQSWKTKSLPKKMEENVKKFKSMNPDYDYELWDDNDCRDFLLQHFGENYLQAFDSLKPGAFKCDFWRYAILYIKGGVYLDIDMVPLVPLREIIKDTDEFVSIVDLKHKLYNPTGCAIYQAFIASVPKHPIMLYALELSFYNIVNRKYGKKNLLNITGPVVAGIATNLYFNKPSRQEISPGTYDNGKLKLLSFRKPYIYDLSDNPIFNIRFYGYNGGENNYRKTANYYVDNSKVSHKRISIAMSLAVIFIISYLVSKLVKCKNFRKE